MWNSILSVSKNFSIPIEHLIFFYIFVILTMGSFFFFFLYRNVTFTNAKHGPKSRLNNHPPEKGSHWGRLFCIPIPQEKHSFISDWKIKAWEVIRIHRRTLQPCDLAPRKKLHIGVWVGRKLDMMSITKLDLCRPQSHQGSKNLKSGSWFVWNLHSLVTWYEWITLGGGKSYCIIYFKNLKKSDLF